MNRHDRAVGGTLTSAARRYDDVPIEVVVRFGVPRREIAIETEVFTPSLVAFCITTTVGPLTRLREWMARRQSARRDHVRLLWRTSP